MFLRGNSRLLESDVITMDQFLEIFSSAIKQARSDILTEEAMQMTTIRKYEETMRASQTNVVVSHQASGNFGGRTNQHAEVLASDSTQRSNLNSSE